MTSLPLPPSAGSPWIKVCGVRTFADLEACAASGATHVGINIWPSSPRAVPLPFSAQLCGAARRLGLSPVLVQPPSSPLGVDHDPVLRPDFIQMDQTPSAQALASAYRDGVSFIETRHAHAGNLSALLWGDVLLLDAPSASLPGGTGEPFDWSLCASAPRPFLLAGGLGPDNVSEAIHRCRPAGVDAASRLESRPGHKDPALVREFCAEAQRAFLEETRRAFFEGIRRAFDARPRRLL